MRRLTLLRIVLVLATTVFSRSGRAEPATLAGRWNATPMRSDWVIGEWGKACGPTPNGGGAVGGEVTISNASTGNELLMTGAGRNYSTAECWEQYPGLARVSHQAGLRSWRSTCKTKPGDARQATLVTTIDASDTRITFDETGQYQFVIAGQNCTASVRRTRSLSLVQRASSAIAAASSASAGSLASAAPSAPSPALAGAGAAAASRPCTELGPPERLEVRPGRKLLRPGEQFEFHSLVLDGAGCTLALSPVWKVMTPSAELELSGPGRVRVAPGAAEATVELQATLAGHSARVVVEVASERRYDALLAQHGLNAEGESADVAVARMATSSIGGGRFVTHDDSQRRRSMFVGVVGGAALMLGLLGFFLVQHSRRKPPLPEPRLRRARVAPTVTPDPVLPLSKVCPTCREEYAPEAEFCPNDGNRLVAAGGNVEPTGPSGGVCPICGQGYDPGILTCPKHGEELLPAAMQAVVRSNEPVVTKKICPVCGKHYSGESLFCGGCGAALVPVN